MPRAIAEWVSKHDDQAIPQRVRLRVFEAHNRTCAECGNEIRPGDGVDYDHAIPLADGGRHCESNLRPVHRKCHKLKTARESHERAESRSKVAKHYGIKKRSQWGSRGFRKAEPQRTATRPIIRKSERQT